MSRPPLSLTACRWISRATARRSRCRPDANAAPTFVSVHVTRVGDAYLGTMGIPLLRGRGFTADDRAGAEMVTVISKPLADQLFPHADAAEAIGKRLTFGTDKKTQQTLTIVGVTGDFPTAQMSDRAGTVAVAAGPAPGLEPVPDRAQRTRRTAAEDDRGPRKRDPRSRSGCRPRPHVCRRPPVFPDRHRGVAPAKQHARLPDAIGRRGCRWQRDPDAGRARNIRRRRIDGRDAYARNRRASRAGRLASTRARHDPVRRREARHARRGRRTRSHGRSSFASTAKTWASR